MVIIVTAHLHFWGFNSHLHSAHVEFACSRHASWVSSLYSSFLLQSKAVCCGLIDITKLSCVRMHECVIVHCDRLAPRLWCPLPCAPSPLKFPASRWPWSISTTDNGWMDQLTSIPKACKKRWIFSITIFIFRFCFEDSLCTPDSFYHLYWADNIIILSMHLS